MWSYQFPSIEDSKQLAPSPCYKYSHVTDTLLTCDYGQGRRGIIDLLPFALSNKDEKQKTRNTISVSTGSSPLSASSSSMSYSVNSHSSNVICSNTLPYRIINLCTWPQKLQIMSQVGLGDIKNFIS